MTIDKRPIAAAIGAMLLLGAIASPASARWGDRDDYNRDHHHWNGGYYRSPPVVYGDQYGNGYYGYRPPPVIYGPGYGVYTPGLNIIVH